MRKNKRYSLEKTCGIGNEMDPGPYPRCLAVLPQNIEELLSKFMAQESQAHSSNSNPSKRTGLSRSEPLL